MNDPNWKERHMAAQAQRVIDRHETADQALICYVFLSTRFSWGILTSWGDCYATIAIRLFGEAMVTYPEPPYNSFEFAEHEHEFDLAAAKAFGTGLGMMYLALGVDDTPEMKATWQRIIRGPIDE